MNQAEFEKYLRKCPVGSTTRLLRIPEITQRWLPWAEEQLSALCQLAGVPEDGPLHRSAGPWYLLLCTHYMLHDAAVDEPAMSLTHIVAAADASALACWSFERDVARHLPPAGVSAARTHVVRYMAERNAALVIEYERKRTRAAPTSVDRDTAIGRNNAPLLALEVLSAATDGPLPEGMVNTVAQLLYLMQLGDDLGDWEEDLRDGNYTPFLRSALSGVEGSPLTSLARAREVVFSTGFYERHVSQLICDFDDLRCTFSTWDSERSERAVAYVDAARAKALGLLRACVGAKLEYLEKRGAA